MELKKHSLSAEVEATSGGRQVVLSTAKGQATYMNVISAFRLEDLGPEFGTGLHPAFVVDGVEKSEIYIGTYQAVIRDGEALSLPNQDPEVEVDYDEAQAACTAAGEGFHLMTNREWAAIALWCQKHGFGQLHGNTNSGVSHLDNSESGKVAKYGRILTGSGPDSWRHDGTPHGIADLVGNVWEWVGGLKLESGSVLMPTDNNYLLAEERWPDTGAKFDFNDGTLQVSDSIDDESRDFDSEAFAELGAKEGCQSVQSLRQALLFPGPTNVLEGRVWVDNNEDFEALPIRGGRWYNGGNAGLAALCLDVERSGRYVGLGFRPAFIP